MHFDKTRDETRQTYFDAWQKFRENQPLEPSEQQIVQVILDHPEYHQVFDNPQNYADREYLPESGETNPYLHLGLHLAIRDQLAVDHPEGIRTVYQQLMTHHNDPLAVEHEIMGALAEEIWRMQRYQSPFDGMAYLANIRTKYNLNK